MKLSIDLQQLSIETLCQIAKEIKDPVTLKQLLEIDEEALCVDIASNIHTDEETLRYLYNKHNMKVIWHVAKNKSAPQEILHDIALKLTQAWEAGELLQNPCLSSEDIDMLLEKYTSRDVRNRVIRNPNSTGNALIKAAGEDSDYILRVLQTGKVKLVPADEELS